MVINYKNINEDLYSKKLIGETKYEHFSAFSYRCYSVCRSKRMPFYAEAFDGDELLYEADLDDYKMRIHCILVEKIVDGSVIDRREFLTGTAFYSATAAYNAIQRRPIDMDAIETVLQENNLPYLKSLNDNIKTYMRIKMHEAVPEKDLMARKKSFNVELLSLDPFFESMIEIAATQER